MVKYLSFVLCLVFVAFVASAAEDVAGAVDGTVKHVSAVTKTVVVKAADGTEHTFHVVDHTTIHGAEITGKGAKDSLHGLKEGSHVAVHYTAKGTEETAEEIDHVGKGGLRVTKGTVTAVDRGAKTMTVKTTDGAEETLRLTDRAATSAGKGIGEGADKFGHVTVYYTEKAGEKVAHFFGRAL
jgi:hypothetical protein